MSDLPTPPDRPPVADRRPRSRVHHGEEFLDPYEWLRDAENPEVIAYLEAENAWTAAQTRHLGELTEEIFTDIKSRTQETDLTVPTYRSHPGGEAFWYYSRTVEGAEYAIYCRAPAAAASPPPALEVTLPGEEVLLDANAAAAGAPFFALGAFAVSPDGRRLAWSTDTVGDERFVLHLRDLTTGEPLDADIPDTAYGAAWAGNDFLLYTRADAAWRPYLVLRHRIGTSPGEDVQVYREADERYWVDIEASRDDAWVLVSTASRLTSECWLLPADQPESEPWVVTPRRQGLEYDVEVAGDRLLVVHNARAEDFELAEAPLAPTTPEEWRPVLPARPGVRVLGVSAYARHAVVSLRRDGLTALHVLPRAADGSLASGRDIGFVEPLHVVDSPGGAEYLTETIRIGYSSMLTPDSVYDYHLDTGELTLRKRTPVLDHPTRGPYRPEDYLQERVWAEAPDGTRIPMSVVRRADVALDGAAPGLLYGYGSYELSVEPGFSVSRLSLLDRGFVFALAHVRGGGELGRSWYEQGKTLSKRNTFTDFVACAEHLVRAGYTRPERLAARGGSAGGLLMGAVANLAPGSFRAIHAAVPFVDPLTTILNPELPLTVIEWEEWGDPLHDPEVYRYMRTYSPYENVREHAYPAILATTSLHDTRVLFVEPAKWVAALRHTASGPAGQPILLKTEMSAGHGGVSGRYAGWRELAFEYAWIIDQVTLPG
ncbi:MAG: S9 family peptidase [Actinomycetes bacterium]